MTLRNGEPRLTIGLTESQIQVVITCPTHGPIVAATIERRHKALAMLFNAFIGLTGRPLGTSGTMDIDDLPTYVDLYCPQCSSRQLARLSPSEKEAPHA